MPEALLLFARIPELGKVKTRLAATLGDAAALRIYQRLLTHTLQITQSPPVDKYVFLAGEMPVRDAWSEAGYHRLPQSKGDLGEKMAQAFQTLFDSGYNRLVIIGTDCAELTSDIICEAFAALHQWDAVIGPARDGGYYLLGMNQLHPALFQDKAWSTANVYAQTKKDFENLNLRWKALPLLSDVDEAKNVPAGWL